MPSSVVAHHNRVVAAGMERALELEDMLARVIELILLEAGRDAARRFEVLTADTITASAAVDRRRYDRMLLAQAGQDEARRLGRFALVAAAPGVTSTSTMVCVKPRADEAAAIAEATGAALPAEELHVTLCYLGDVPGDLSAVRDALAVVAGSHATLAGRVGGAGSFGDNGDGYPSILLPSVPGLVELRVDVAKALAAGNVDYSRDYGFVPHVSVAYTPMPEVAVDAIGLDLHFDELLLVRGDMVEAALPLVGGKPITAAVERPPWTAPATSELVDADAIVAKLRGKTDPVRLAVVESVMKETLGSVGIEFDVDNPYTQQVFAHAGEHITHVTDTTRVNVGRIVSRSYEEGLSIPATAKAIRQGMTEASAKRARLIARTEMVGAVNGGSLAATQIVAQVTAEQDGVSMVKVWNTAPGAENPRHETYAGLNGQTRELDERFDVGSSQLMYPGDGAGAIHEIANCRCALSYEDQVIHHRAKTKPPDDVTSGTPDPVDPIFVARSILGKDELRGLPERTPEQLAADRKSWRTGVEPGDDGLYHVYHGTTRERADLIQRTGLNKPGDTGLTLTTSPGQALRYARGYDGEPVVVHFALTPAEAREFLLRPEQHDVYDFPANAHKIKDVLPTRLLAGERAPLATTEASMSRPAFVVAPVPSPTVGIHAETRSGYGNSETLAEQHTATRDTGHFGTGTYFVSDAERLAGLALEERDIVGIDLTGRRLFRPVNERFAYSTHDALAKVDDLVSSGVREGRVGDLQLEGLATDLPTGATGTMIREAIESARNDVAAGRFDTESAATRVMRSLGYDGVDVRHLPGLDNTKYGSVLYRVPDDVTKAASSLGSRVDQVGRLANDTKVLVDGGYGDSPMVLDEWKQLDLDRTRRTIEREIPDAKWATSDAHNAANDALDRFGLADVRVLRGENGELQGLVAFDSVEDARILKWQLQTVEARLESAEYGPTFPFRRWEDEVMQEGLYAEYRRAIDPAAAFDVTHLAWTNVPGADVKLLHEVAKAASQRERGVQITGSKYALEGENEARYGALGMVERDPGSGVFWWHPDQVKEFARTGELPSKPLPPKPPPPLPPPPPPGGAERPFAHYEDATITTQIGRTRKRLNALLEKDVLTAVERDAFDADTLRLQQLQEEKTIRSAQPKRPHAHVSDAELTSLTERYTALLETDLDNATRAYVHDQLRGVERELKARGLIEKKRGKTLKPKPPQQTIGPPSSERVQRLRQAYARRGSGAAGPEARPGGSEWDVAMEHYGGDRAAGFRSLNEYEQELLMDMSPDELVSLADRAIAAGADLAAEVEARLEGSMGATMASVRRQTTKQVLSEVRPVGTGGTNAGKLRTKNAPGQLNVDVANAKSAIDEASEWYPSEWLDFQRADGDISLMEVKRGYHSGGGHGHGSTIALSKRNSTISGDSDYFNVAVHELGHGMEATVPGIKAAESGFYRRRTEGLKTRKYKYADPDKLEVVREDSFIDEYMGKDYGMSKNLKPGDPLTKDPNYFPGATSPYELLSMGMDQMFGGGRVDSGKKLWDADPEMRNFILGLLVIF